MKRTYYALSTTNYRQNGYTIYATGADKIIVAQTGEDAIPKTNDIYEETLRRNLIVMSKAKAKQYRVNQN